MNPDTRQTPPVPATPSAPDGVAFEELFDLGQIQELQDRFARATGVASLIIHPDGTPITRPSNFCALCENVIRPTEQGLANCRRSDAILGRYDESGPIIQPCLSGGLWDAGASIGVGGRHIASWLIGQVRNEAQSEESMLAYARQIGTDEAAFLAAFRQVPAMSEQRFREVADALFTLARQLSSIAYQNVQQARFIAERARTDAALRITEARERAVIANMTDVIGILDRHGAGRYSSANLTRWFGWQTDEVLGSPLWTRIHSEDLPRIQAAFTTLLQSPRATASGECRYRCKDGSYKWVEFEASNLLHDPDIDGIFIHYRDISVRKQAQDALVRERTLLRAILDSAPGIMYLYDDQGHLVQWNRKHEEWTGYAPDELSRMSLMDWYPGDLQSQQAVTEGVSKTIQEGYGEAEALLRKKDGSKVPMHFTASRLTIDGRMYFAGIGLDLTERKRMEQERERLQEQLLQAQKVESVGRLAGGVAHDFNNMLGVILGNVELALEEAAPSTPLHDSLMEIQKAARRSADLTRQLLAFARKQTISPRILDLNEALAGMLKMLKRLIGEEIELTWLPGPNLWPVRIDPVQLDQVLANLTVNARDAIKGMGKIAIETRNLTFDADHVPSHAGVIPGDYVMLAVTDTGVGMGQAVKAHLFEPFFTTKEVGEGTGLGLATVYGIVKQNEGHISVYSEPGQGSTFKILLPRAGAPPLPNAADAAPTSVKGSGTLLLVEDEEQILSMSRRILAEHGYTVLAARTPEDALTLVAEFPGTIDLLVTDVVMPGMNGRTLFERVSQLKPGLRCLYMSGYTANVIAHQGVLEDGVNFLEKPFAAATLTRKVRQLLDRP